MQEALKSFGILGIYYLVCASTVLLLRFTKTIPDEIFRKMLHFVLLGSLTLTIFVFPEWWIAALGSIGFALAVYPILWLAEHLKNYSQVVTERKSGELKSSLLLVFFMFAGVVTVCWGIFEDRWLALASIYAWGTGDAVAALVGKRFGKHKIGGAIVQGRKSVEGTAAMFVTSFISVLCVLLMRGGLALPACIVISLVTAAVSALVELYSQGGNDTVTCPTIAMVIILSLVHVFGGGL